MAIGFFQKAEGSVEILLPKDAQRLSVNQMANVIIAEKDSRESTPENVIARIWSVNRPVVHLSAALAFEMFEIEKKDGKSISVLDLLLQPELVKRIVWRAELLENLMPKTGLNIDRKKLVHLRFPLHQYPQKSVSTNN
jgi:hypothetical protein